MDEGRDGLFPVQRGILRDRLITRHLLLRGVHQVDHRLSLGLDHGQLERIAHRRRRLNFSLSVEEWLCSLHAHELTVVGGHEWHRGNWRRHHDTHVALGHLHELLHLLSHVLHLLADLLFTLLPLLSFLLLLLIIVSNHLLKLSLNEAIHLLLHGRVDHTLHYLASWLGLLGSGYRCNCRLGLLHLLQSCSFLCLIGGLLTVRNL